MSIQDKFENMRVSRNMREKGPLRSSRRGPDLNLTTHYESNPLRKSLLKQKYGNPQSFRSHEGFIYRDPIREHPIRKHHHLLLDPYERVPSFQNHKNRDETSRSNSQNRYSRFRKHSPKFSTPS